MTRKEYMEQLKKYLKRLPYVCKWCTTGIGHLVKRFVRKKVGKDE